MSAAGSAPTLATDRLTLRPPAPRDWEAYAAFSLSDRARFVRSAEVTRPLAWRAFAAILGHWALRGTGLFVFTDRGSDLALGAVGPWFPEGWPEREIAWSAWAPAAEGTGRVREAAAAARDHAFRDLGWTTAVSYIAEGNVRSIALAERLGATVDPAAATAGGAPCRVYRHPAP